ncbi:MAG: DUF4236 domain-containing protein [Pirellulales bacterium]
MGFYIRKSFKVGPARINLSKRGVGGSVGVKGARVGVNAKGKGYVHGGRGGLYYRKEFGSGSNRTDTTAMPRQSGSGLFSRLFRAFSVLAAGLLALAGMFIFITLAIWVGGNSDPVAQKRVLSPTVPSKESAETLSTPLPLLGALQEEASVPAENESLFSYEQFLKDNPKPIAPAKEFRTWSDSTGNFSTKARLVTQITGGDSAVRLEKADGTTVTVFVSQLSQGDKDHLKEYRAAERGFATAIEEWEKMAGLNGVSIP